MSDLVPDCMMPDGAEPCAGYQELMGEIERLREALRIAQGNTDAAIDDYNDARARVLDDMRECVPTHPPLRGLILAFLDAYKRASGE